MRGTRPTAASPFNHPKDTMTNFLSDQATNLAEQAAVSADHALKAGQRLTHDALDSLSDSVHDLRVHGTSALRSGARQIRNTAHHASVCTKDYIRDEPVRSVLIAAAAGTILVGLLSLVSRPRRHE